ncbi:MAG: hypothetical protein WCO56_06780, partial [Verrucomicrobiota bacterium]
PEILPDSLHDLKLSVNRQSFNFFRYHAVTIPCSRQICQLKEIFTVPDVDSTEHGFVLGNRNSVGAEDHYLQYLGQPREKKVKCVTAHPGSSLIN